MSITQGDGVRFGGKPKSKSGNISADESNSFGNYDTKSQKSKTSRWNKSNRSGHRGVDIDNYSVSDMSDNLSQYTQLDPNTDYLEEAIQVAIAIFE